MLTGREWRFLNLLFPDHTITIGLKIGKDLKHRGLVTVVRRRQNGLGYALTEAGKRAHAEGIQEEIDFDD